MTEFVLRLSAREHKILVGALDDLAKRYREILSGVNPHEEFDSEQIETLDVCKKRLEYFEQMIDKLTDVYGFERCEIDLIGLGRKKGNDHGKARS